MSRRDPLRDLPFDDREDPSQVRAVALGRLSVSTEPAGAEATLYTTVERDGGEVLEPSGRLGRTPLIDIRVRAGRHVVLLRAPGRVEVAYPVYVGASGSWATAAPGESEAIPVHLPRHAELRPHERYVPAGWTFSCRHGRWIWVDGFVVNVAPVSRGELACYLRETGREVPWVGSDLSLPASDVTPEDAAAYIEWISRWTGRPYRRVTDAEWEKVTQGVAPPYAVAPPRLTGAPRIGSLPRDKSPYGVRPAAEPGFRLARPIKPVRP